MRTFVVGTGRCGSLSLARWLQDSGLVTEMEPHAKQLCCLANDRLRGHSWDRGVLAKLWSRVPVGGAVVDNNLSLFIEDLARIGDARFVWLIRNPWDCISSLMAWKWYRDYKDVDPDDVFARNRLTAPMVGKIGEMSPYRWHCLPKLGKCAWYWKFLNFRIEQQLARLDEDAWIRVRLEDWSPATAEAVLRFVSSVGPGSTVDWALPTTNRGRWNEERPRWTDDEVALVEEVAGTALWRWYFEGRFKKPSRKESEEAARRMARLG